MKITWDKKWTTTYTLWKNINIIIINSTVIVTIIITIIAMIICAAISSE